MSIEAGKLRHQIRIEQPVTVQDATTGETTTTWETFLAGVPCAIEPASVRDFIQSAAMQSDITVRVVFRYFEGVSKDMRFVAESGAYLGTVFNPKGLLRDKESGLEYITAPCSEGVNEGDF
jgi:SPP1 family predicted phage head-tail adaptor